MAIAIKVLKGNSPVGANTKVSGSISTNLGILSKVTNISALTNSSGEADFKPGIDLVGYTWKASATSGIYYGSATGTADGFGNGTGEILMTANPVGGLVDAITNSVWTVVLLIALAGVAFIVYELVDHFLARWSPGGVIGEGGVNGIVKKFTGLFGSLKKRLTSSLNSGHGY